MCKSLCYLLVVLGLALPVSASAQIELKSYSGYESKIMALDIEGLHPPALYFRSTIEGIRPLAIFLHGRGGDRGGKIVNPNSEIAQKLSEQKQACDVIQPLSIGGWSPTSLDELIDLMIEEHDIDKDRIYILGSSMGGAGTWKYGFEGKHDIAAFVPIASGASKTDKVHDRWDITVMKDKPIWMFHGEADTVVPFSNAKETAEEMKAINPKFKWTAFPGVAHGSRAPALKTDALYSWMLQQKCGG
jgi:predicted peptidase